MMASGDRSVTAHSNISASIIQTGDGNTATLTDVRLPPAESVDIQSVLTQLATLLETLKSQDSDRIRSAVDAAKEEGGKTDPDKAEVAGRVTRALEFARRAADFSEHAEKIQGLATQVAGWLGAASPYVSPLLIAAGYSAG